MADAPGWWQRRQAGTMVTVRLGEGDWATEALVATGARSGPTLAVLGAVHGDEYEGPVAIAEILAGLDPQALSGTVIAVPVANTAAFLAGTRTSPLDGLNLARTFPGDLTGTPSERLAAVLTEEVIGLADALIDLHSAGVAYEMALLAGFCDLSDETGRRSRELALAFGAPVIWEHPEIAPGRTLSVASDRGIPSLYTEAAGGGGAPEPVVRCYVEGVQRVLVALGMLPGEPPTPRHREFWHGAGNTDHAVAAPTSGLFRSRVAVGDTVAAGATLGEIIGGDGTLRAQLTAAEGGVVAMVRRIPRVAADDGLYLLTQRVEQ